MELIVTVIAEDRPGVIEQVAEVVSGNHGSWQESRMAQLAGSFAGIIAVQVPDMSAEALSQELRALRGIVVHVAQGLAPLPSTQRHTLQVVANDRPGIVAEVSAALAARGINVAELATAVHPASMSGGTVFRATIDVGLTSGQRIDDVIAGLEGLSDDLMIDVADGEPLS